MPSDPLAAIFGEEAIINMTEEMKENLIVRFGLDKPLYIQFIIYLKSLLSFDLGFSYFYNTTVLDLVLGALPWTLLLVGLGIIIATFLGFVLGLEGGYRHGQAFDRRLLASVMFLNGLPDYFLGIVFLLLFAVTLGICPLGGAMTPYSQLTGIDLVGDVLWHLLLPLLTLVIVEITSCYLLTRNTVIGILGEGFILTARGKGLKNSTIKYKHIGRNSLTPLLTRTGMRLGRMVTGVLFIEVVFSYPGLGSLIINALSTRDYPVLQGVFFLVAIGVLGFNFLAELLNKKLDPRVK